MRFYNITYFKNTDNFILGRKFQKFFYCRVASSIRSFYPISSKVDYIELKSKMGGVNLSRLCYNFHLHFFKTSASNEVQHSTCDLIYYVNAYKTMFC